MRHWAFDLARFFELDPVVILTTWSLGQVVEAHWAMQTYQALAAIQEDRAKSSSSFQNQTSALGSWH